MLIPINPLEEQEKIAKIEMSLMKRLGLTYTDFQKIPLRVIQIWLKQQHKEAERIRFQQMVMKNSRPSN